MGLKHRLEKDLRDALRNRDEQRKMTLRLVLAAIKNAEIEKRGELEEGELLAVLSKQAKQRRESAAQFAEGGREDLVAQEERELEIIEEYIPAQLSEEEIEARAREVIQEIGATTPSQMGEVMRVLMPQMKGRADGRLVNTIVTAILSETA
ncbi:MAG TPA: GatB/YqeY domain-containing protein [Anaerolineae bacterium]|nr:GatB/YqeY domain-containing protein [Anaerolineae bacterium]